MIKKISAILLALVLCLSVVVVPASAAVELGDAQIAFALEWDKEYYSAGDTATLSIYVDAADDLSLATGAITIGLNSATINMADNPIADVKANSTTSDVFASFYKTAEVNTAWFTTATLMSKLTAANTAEENEKYDTYLKFLIAKDSSGGSHENTGVNNAGFGGADFDPTEPIVTYTFVIADGVADGTPVEAAITTGSYSVTPVAQAQTSWKYYSQPGVKTTTANITAANFDASQAVATATIGEAVVPATPLSVAPLKTQIKYNDIYTDSEGNEVATFNYRIIAELDNFYDIYTDAADAADISDGNGIKEAGFIYNRGSAVDVDKAMDQINGGTVTYPGKQHQKSAYISMTAISGKVAMACVVYNIPDTDADETLSVLAYLKYVQDGEEKIAYCDAYTGTFTLYSSDGR